MSNRTIRTAFFLCGFAAFLNLYSTQGILRELAVAFGVSAERAGQGVSATTLAVAIIAPFVGTLAARFARRTVIVCAALAVALPVAWSAHATSFPSFLAARFAAGELGPFSVPIAFASVGELFTRAAATALSALFVAGTTLGGFAGRFVTNPLTSVAAWRHALDVVAALCVAAGFAIHACLPAPAQAPHAARSRDRAARASRWASLTRGPLLASFAIGACVLASQVATFTFIGLRLAQAPFGFGTTA
ncbi:MFS transporter, partial [Paraburkholderia sp. Se-20369]|nr:MFS transporter [Paraburkholderia sp. Se-20369]